jgi:glycosyltransferase involved in cell wall biosynthesis
MKIAINTRLLIEGKLEGIGWFTYETLKRIVKQYPQHQFYFLFDRSYSKQFIFASNVFPIVLGPPARHPFLWYWWFEHSVPRILRKIKPDVFVSPDGYLSLSTDIKSIAVIHDLNFEHYPKKLRWLVKKYLLYYFPKFASRANRIITVSEFSKLDISRTYGTDPEKIDVVYNGASSSFKPLNDDEKSAARKEFTGGSAYFIYIGALLPRKNLARLLQAFENFKDSIDSDMKMVLVGAKMFHTADITHTLKSMKHKTDVIFFGHLTSGKIELALGGAVALTYVSYFEGFGIPLVEAMYSDVPVITSDKSSLPEVAGDAALFIDPFSAESIQKAMLRIYLEEGLRASLIEKGRIQRQKFNWDITARMLWESIEKCLE